jgi:hypothetical protein
MVSAEEDKEKKPQSCCTTRVRILLIPLLALIDAGVNVLTMHFRGDDMLEPWSHEFTLGDSIYDLYFTALFRFLFIIVSIPLVRSYYLPTFESFEFNNDASYDLLTKMEHNSKHSTHKEIEDCIQTPLISDHDVEVNRANVREVVFTSSSAAATPATTATAAETAKVVKKDKDKKESPPLKALNNYVSTWTVLLWSCAIGEITCFLYNM